MAAHYLRVIGSSMAFRPLSIRHSFHFFNFSFNSSSHFPTSTRSSAYSISYGRPSLTLCVTASITIMKSSGLITEPWCTPTFIPNHSLTDPPYDLILVLACLYMAITALTNHSSTLSFLMAPLHYFPLNIFELKQQTAKLYIMPTEHTPGVLNAQPCYVFI